MCYQVTCDDAPLKELARRNYTLNETQLISLCPPTLELFNCYSKFARDCFEMELEDLAKSNDPYAKVIATKVLEAKILAIEMCDENSTLRKDYLENVGCFSQGEYVNWSERSCLETVYSIACLAEQLERTCGEVARRTFLTLLEKVKSVIREDCNVVDPLSFKRSFFEYLELEDKISEFYRSTLEYFNCFFKDIKECTGKDVEEYIESLDEFGKLLAQSLWNGRNLAIEMCNEHSTLRRDYLANVDCYVDMIEEAYSACREKADSDTEAFLRKYHNLTEDEDVNWGEQGCLGEVYELACLAEKLEDSCSEAARRAFLNIREKVNPSLHSACDVEDPMSFRRSFFEHLGLVGKKAEIYRHAYPYKESIIIKQAKRRI
ncbi:hypothetical protein HNY73_016151 [Argiope bruennichi]|uniref:Uncharacterized protein n=1 Tax=Argiope bruennichi TaxID=94029 RepID=A0A8T0EHW7_ARGBR|nr:hypothetical protein HNY73_016151 [Argiope bruennichi]